MAEKLLSASIILNAGGVKKGVDDADAQFGRLGGSADKLSKDLDAKTSKMGSGFTSLGNTLGQFGVPFTGALTGMGAKLDEADKHASGFGGSIATAGLAVAAGAGVVIASSIDMAAKYDQATASIAANSDISTGAAKKIGQAFLATGGTTTFSAQEMATAYASVGAQLGQTEGHALSAGQATAVMKASMDLAEGSGTGLGTATSSLADIMQTYGLKTKDAASTSDILFNTSRLTGQGIDAVTATVTKLKTQLGAMAPSLSDTSALMLDLKNHGESGKGALSAVNSAVTALLKPLSANNIAVSDANNLLEALPPNLQPVAQAFMDGTMTSKQYAKETAGLSMSQQSLMTQFQGAAGKVQTTATAMTNMGISVTDSNGKFIGMKGVIAELQPKLQGLTQDQQMASLQTVFGAQANRKLLDVVLAGPAAYDAASASITKSGSAADAANKQSSTMEGSWKKIKVSVNDARVELGEKMMPIVTKVAQELAKFAAGVVKDWPTISAAFKVAIDIIKPPLVVLVDTIGTVGGALIKTGKFIADHKVLLVALGAAVGAVAVPAIIALGISLGTSALAFAAEGIAAAVAWAATLGPITLVIAAIAAVAAGVYEIIDHWGAIVGFFTSIGSKIVSALSSLGSMLSGVFTGAMGSVMSAINSGWSTVANFFTSMPTKILGLLGDATSWLAKTGLSVLTGLWNGISGGASWLGKQMLHVGEWVLNAVNTADQWLLTTGLKILTGLWNGIWGAAGWLHGQLAGIGQWVLNAVAGAGSWLLNTGTNILTGLWNGISGSASWLWSQLGQIPGWIWGVMKDAGTWLLTTGENIITGLWNGISGMGGWLWGKVQGFASHFVKDAIHGILGIFSPSQVMFQSGMYIAQGLAGGIESGMPLVGAQSAKMANLIAGIGTGSAGSFGSIAAGSGAAAALAGGSTVQPGVAQPTATNLVVNVTVQGNVMTAQSLTDAVYQGLLKKSLVNGSGGQILIPATSGT